MGNPGGTSKVNGKRELIVPDGGWGWVVVLGSFLIHVIADGFVYSFGVLVEELIKDFHASKTTSALVISLLTGLTLGSGPIASALTNRFGCRQTAMMGSVIASFGCFASIFVTDVYQITISVGIIMGFGFGLMYCPAIIIVTMYFKEKRALATGITVCGAGVGTFVFAPINEAIIKIFGWRAVFKVFTGVVLFCTLCAAVFKPLQFQEVSEDEEEKKAQDATHKEDTALLVAPKEVRRAHSTSTSQIDKTGIAYSKSDLRSAHSTSQMNATGLRSRSGTISSVATGYMNKKDVFFTGSIHSLNLYKENPEKIKSITSLHHKEDDEQEASGALRVLRRMLDLDLLVHPAFMLFAISNLMTSVGFNSPLYFLPSYAESGLKLKPEEGALSVSVFGITNTIGRLIFGLVGDRELPLPNGWGKDQARNRLWIYNLSLAFCGVVTAASYFFDTFTALCVYSGFFGFTISSYVCLTSVILVDLIGLDKLTNAFGLLLLFQGVGTIFGPPVTGLLIDLTGSYHPGFVFCGINLAVSGLMLFVIPLVVKKEVEEEEPIQNGITKRVIMH